MEMSQEMLCETNMNFLSLAMAQAERPSLRLLQKNEGETRSPKEPQGG